MELIRILICGSIFTVPVHAREVSPEVTHGCERICSHYGPEMKIITDPQCQQRCQADVYNCIEGTLPKEEAAGDRMKCIQESLLVRIREDGDLVIKIAYDVPPTYEQFDQLFEEDGRIDSRDMAVAKEVLDQAKPKGSTIPAAKVNVILEVWREADQDADGVVTEGEFNAYAMDNSEHLSPKKEELPDLPDFAQIDAGLKQSALRSPKPHHKKVHRNQEKQRKVKQVGLAYFQHLLRLGLRVYRSEEKLRHPIAVLASEMYKAPGTESKDFL